MKTETSYVYATTKQIKTKYLKKNVNANVQEILV